MNDTANQTDLLDTEKNATSDASGTVEIQRQDDVTAKIASTLPRDVDGGQFDKPDARPGRPAKPDHLLKNPRRRALKNGGDTGKAFSAPARDDAKSAEQSGADRVSNLQPEPIAPPVSDAEYSSAGLGLAEIHCDIYLGIAHTAAAPIKSCKNFPQDSLDGIMSRAVAPELAKNNLAQGYAAGLKALNVPPGVVKAGGFVHGVVILHRHMMGLVAEIRELAASVVASQKQVDSKILELQKREEA